jgi:tRNA modification GTPase
MFSLDDTIVAIATAPGRGAIGIVRLSGSDAARIVSLMIERHQPLMPRRATLARLVSRRAGETRSVLDRVLVTYFPAPASYTGEDVVEISAHGSPVLLREILGVAVQSGARLARPGEFTLRAFLNQRVDLVQAEAVGDLVEAVTPTQVRLAADQLEGTLTRAIAGIAEGMFDLEARLEASIDFPDEGYRFVERDEAARTLATLADQVDLLLSGARQGRMIRDGGHAVILGRPNVGKSSVFNNLTGVDRAIVAATPGTTRDLVTEQVEVLGAAVTLVDTAGLRSSGDQIEREGVARARQAQAAADVVIVVLDRSVPLELTDVELLDATRASARVVVANKVDLPAAWSACAAGDPNVVEASMVTGAGSAELREAVFRALTSGDGSAETPAVSNQRHIELLTRVQSALTDASRAAAELSEEFVLADMRRASEALEEITGRRASEDLLAHIFQRFCIGK